MADEGVRFLPRLPRRQGRVRRAGPNILGVHLNVIKRVSCQAARAGRPTLSRLFGLVSLGDAQNLLNRAKRRRPGFH